MLNEPMVPAKEESMVELEVPKLLKSTGVVATGTPLLQFVGVDYCLWRLFPDPETAFLDLGDYP